MSTILSRSVRKLRQIPREANLNGQDQLFQEVDQELVNYSPRVKLASAVCFCKQHVTGQQ